MAQRLVEVLAKPIRLFGQDCHVSASIGITVFPTDGKDTDALIKNADIAMYHAKEKGKNAYQYFEDAMNVAAVERVELEGRLRHALEQGHLELFYQPQVHGVTRLGGDPDGRVEAVGLLLRLRRLGEDALRKVEPAAQRREHAEHLGRGLLEAGVELACQRVQALCGGGRHAGGG